MSFIQCADATIAYEEYGTGEPLVLLPGLLGSVDSHWRRFLSGYAQHFHTIAVDLRGHGRSNNPAGELRLSRLIDDLHVLLDTLQIERTFLCGYSLGGYIALGYALRHPAVVRAAVIHATKFFWNAGAVRDTLECFDPDRLAARHPERTAALEQEHRSDTGGWRRLMDAGSRFVTTLADEGIPAASLHGIAAPVLVTQCALDEMIPVSEAGQLAAAIPGAQVYIFPEGKHALASVPKQPFLEVTTRFLLSGSAAPIG
jgi:pimeloyl-ACP methyl ester carboxylesterase